MQAIVIHLEISKFESIKAMQSFGITYSITHPSTNDEHFGGMYPSFVVKYTEINSIFWVIQQANQNIKCDTNRICAVTINFVT